MTVYRRGPVYWFDFVHKGQRVQRSTRQGNRRVADKWQAPALASAWWPSAYRLDSRWENQPRGGSIARFIRTRSSGISSSGLRTAWWGLMSSVLSSP
jgi:hypothetical protein